MTNDNPLMHPENAPRFVAHVAAYSLGLVAVLWVFEGAPLTRLPAFAVLLVSIVAVLAWWPIVFHFKLTHTQEWTKARSIFSSARSLMLWLGFILWGTATAALALLTLRELPQ